MRPPLKFLEAYKREALLNARTPSQSARTSAQRPPRFFANARGARSCIAALDPNDPEESARRALNAGADALALGNADGASLSARMRRLWAVADFLKCHARTQPLWWRDGVFAPSQISDALEAGVRCVSLYPALVGGGAIPEILDCAQSAGLCVVWELADTRDACLAEKFGAVFCAATPKSARLLPPSAPCLALDISHGAEPTPAALARAAAVICAPLPADEEEAQAVVRACKARG